MSKMSKHERAIRDRIKSLEEAIDSLMAHYDHAKSALYTASKERDLLQEILDDAEENGSTPAAEEDEKPTGGGYGGADGKIQLAPSGEPGLRVAGEGKTGGVKEVG